MEERFRWIDHLPKGYRLRRMLETVLAEYRFTQFRWPGHFYSPISSREEIVRDQERIFNVPLELPEIDLRESAQRSLLAKLAEKMRSDPLPRTQEPNKRYYTDNPYFFVADALALAGMLKEFKPRRYTEIGSGFTSALALDLRDGALGGKLQCTFIEPSADRLRGLLRSSDAANTTIHEQRVQDVPDEVFTELGENDFLFVDGSHVAKIGSDVNDILFRVLPLLQPGALIHIHDILWPFEYSRENAFKGYSWNEAYIVRAFLANNPSYQIEFFPSWFERCHPQEWFAAFPAARASTATSLWIRKS